MRSINLAEKMAGSMEAERRAAQEMEIARQVQSRLLPQQAPVLHDPGLRRTMHSDPRCGRRLLRLPRFRFWTSGPGAGRHFRQRHVGRIADGEPSGQPAQPICARPGGHSPLLRSVNRLFYKNTEDNNYATMFFAVYDDETRRLRYVNCGHNPPFLARADGSVERLAATATVLGLFEEWDCTVAELELASGRCSGDLYRRDLGSVAERRGRVWGGTSHRGRARHRQRSADEILEAILSQVQEFSQGEQADDMTLIVARGR